MKHTLSLLMLLGLAVDTARGIVTSDEFGSHVVTPGEPSFGVNTDGVLIVGGLRGSGEPVRVGSAALITDRHVLSAAHCFDQDGDGQVDWELGLFPHEMVFELADGLVAIEYELDSIQWPDTWPASRGDLAVVTLTADAPASVPRYPLYGAHDEVGQPVVLVGYGNPGHGSTGEGSEARPTKRAGLNRYEAIRDDYVGVDFLAYDFDSGQPENNALEIFGVESDLGFGADEVCSAVGDSGGPNFVRGAIAGVTAFGLSLPEAEVNDQTDSSWGEAGFDTRVSMFREFILNSTDGEAVFITAADFDGDGDVDGDDFLRWQASFGVDAGGDVDGDGDTDGDDFLIWQSHFGSGSRTASAAVPEPVSILLLIAAFLGTVFFSRSSGRLFSWNDGLSTFQTTDARRR